MSYRYVRGLRRPWRGMRGMGVLNYYDLLAQANLQNCDPMDSACVSNNVAREAAVEDYWAAHQATGVPDNTRLTFSDQTPSQVAEFYNPQNMNWAGNVVDDRGIMRISGDPIPAYNPGPTYTPPPVAPQPPVVPPKIAVLPPTPYTPAPAPPPAPGTPGGPAVINSSGAGPALTDFWGLPSKTSSAVASVPWWVWVGGVGVGLYAFGGSRGR